LRDKQHRGVAVTATAVIRPKRRREILDTAATVPDQNLVVAAVSESGFEDWARSPRREAHVGFAVLGLDASFAWYFVTSVTAPLVHRQRP
jgi:hypothetical protein